MKPSTQLLTVEKRSKLAYEMLVNISLDSVLGEEWSKDSVSLKSA